MKRALIAALMLAPTLAAAQTRLDIRVEAVESSLTTGAEAAVGLRSQIGSYLRAEASVAGAFWQRDSVKLSSPRTEAAVRFLLDPINERKWGLSFAGGLGYAHRPYLLVAADLEGQPIGGWRPAVRFSLGGGVRAGLILRRSARDRR